MKYLIAAAVSLLIIIVPFGSWYYLQTGLNYRKASIEELKPKAELEDITSALEIFQGATSLLYNGNVADDARKEVEVIFEQYQSGLTFQLVEISNDSIPGDLGSNHIKISDQAFTSAFDNTAAFALIDTSGSVRNYYNNTPEDISKLVEHLAIVIPLPKRKDIKMKNGKDVDAKPSFMKKNQDK